MPRTPQFCHPERSSDEIGAQSRDLLLPLFVILSEAKDLCVEFLLDGGL